MASVDVTAFSSAAQTTHFDALYLGSTNQQVVCRIIRLWDARNTKQSGEFVGIVVLLLDEKYSVIHAFVPKARESHFRAFLVEGRVIKLSRFEVSRCTKMHKITDYPFVIRFLQNTTVDHLTEDVPKIAAQKFHVRKLDHLLALANTNLEHPDIVGNIRSIQGSNLDDTSCTELIVVRLIIEPSVTVSLLLLDAPAADFRGHLASGACLHTTVLVTTVNPKLSGGTLFLNSTQATRFYTDINISPIAEFNNRVTIEELHFFSRVDTAQDFPNMRSVTVEELYTYISQPTEQEKEAEFLCKATIIGVLQRNGWNYVACAFCTRKLDRNTATVTCNRCASHTVAVPRYRIELAVSDGFTDSTFIVFDNEMTRVLCKTASTLLAEAEENGEEALPDCLQKLAGKHFSFHIKVTPLNFTTRHRGFTVARMTEQDEASRPTQVEKTPRALEYGEGPSNRAVGDPTSAKRLHE